MANQLEGSRWALWKNSDDLSISQHLQLASIQVASGPLYRAYLLKEQLRLIFQLPVAHAMQLLEEWIGWVLCCRMPLFVKLASTIRDHRAGIAATRAHGLSNPRVAALNTRICLIAIRAFGSHTTDALIVLAMLSLGGLRPPLPGRS